MIESERKFLVIKEKLPNLNKQSIPVRIITSGYFTQSNPAIRVTYSDKSKICFKAGKGEHRSEFEYDIPVEDAASLMDISPTEISKARYDYEGWEIDCIWIDDSDPKKDIWVCEWEDKPDKSRCPAIKPEWVGEEVTNNLDWSMQALAWKYGKK